MSSPASAETMNYASLRIAYRQSPRETARLDSETALGLGRYTMYGLMQNLLETPGGRRVQPVRGRPAQALPEALGVRHIPQIACIHPRPAPNPTSEFWVLPEDIFMRTRLRNVALAAQTWVRGLYDTLSGTEFIASGMGKLAGHYVSGPTAVDHDILREALMDQLIAEGTSTPDSMGDYAARIVNVGNTALSLVTGSERVPQVSLALGTFNFLGGHYTIAPGTGV
jgi:hypothetical protein